MVMQVTQDHATSKGRLSPYQDLSDGFALMASPHVGPSVFTGAVTKSESPSCIMHWSESMVRLLSTSYPVEFNPVYQCEEIDSFINPVNNLF